MYIMCVRSLICYNHVSIYCMLCCPQLSVQALEEKESEVEEERMKLCGEIQQLRAENSQLGSQVEGLQQQSLQQQGPTCSQEQVRAMYVYMHT